MFKGDFLIAPVLVLSASSDIISRKIPNKLIIAGYFLCSLFLGPAFSLRFLAAILTAFLFTKLIPQKIFGGGDLKLTALIYAALGSRATILIFLLSLLIAAFHGTYLVVFRKMSLKTKLPMAVYMLIGFLLYEIFRR